MHLSQFSFTSESILSCLQGLSTGRQGPYLVPPGSKKAAQMKRGSHALMGKCWLQNQLTPETRNSKPLLLHLQTNVDKANLTLQIQSVLSKLLHVVDCERHQQAPPLPAPMLPKS